jgi:hypothetical protein
MLSDPSSPRRHACPPAHSCARGWARLASAALACTLAVTAVPARASAAPDSNEIERLYNEGSQRNAVKNYSGAAESWTELLILLPEQSANQSTRESVLLNVLEAYMNAYNGMRNADNTKDIQHLRKAQRVLEQYLGAFQSAYGRGKGVSSAVQQAANELDELLKKAEEESRVPVTPVDDGKTTPPGDRGVVDDPPPPPPIVLPPENNGIGLIAGGSVMLGAGLASLALIIVGGVDGKKAEQEFEKNDAEIKDICMAMDTTTCAANTSLDGHERVPTLVQNRDEAKDVGDRSNALTIAGAVIAPLLLAGGATMLAFGIKRNREAKAATRPNASFRPALGPRFTGFVIEGRF